jgi:hypothetical protein
VSFSGRRTLTGSRPTVCATFEVGSFRSPTRIASTGQTTDARRLQPTSIRWAQKLHFSAEWSSGLMKIASYGHAAMHALQPMHACLSKSTMPSSRLNIAEVGQAVTHGASAHWLQRVTWKLRRACGNTPTSTDFT